MTANQSQTARRRGTPRIQSLARASEILGVIAANDAASLAEISSATGLNKTTAYYLAESLADLGFAERIGGGKGYRLGLRNLELGRAVQRRLDVAAAGRPALVRLCAATKETVNLALPFVFDAMIVESLDGAYGVRATSYAGSRAPYHSSACGKVILAFQPEAVREAIYEARPLLAVTRNTITDRERLETDLARIRRRGYATDIEENELDAHCAAAPIRDPFGEVVAAVSVSGPATRIPRSVLGSLAAKIIAETEWITRRMGEPPA